MSVVLACGTPTPSGSGGGGGGGGGSLATGGGSAATGGGTGNSGQGCPWLADCAANCPQSDQACLDTCGAQASSTAVSQYNALIDCANNASCADEPCIETNCAAQLTACRGSAGTGGGGGNTGGGGGTTGLTTSGSCEIRVNAPNTPPINYCWDYVLTVTTGHNDGIEHWVYRDTTTVGGGQSTCTGDNGLTFTAAFNGPWDNAAASQQNVTNKQNACNLSGSQLYTTATWTPGAACSLSGSLGHCNRNVTNTWDGANITSLVQTTWLVP